MFELDSAAQTGEILRAGGLDIIDWDQLDAL